MRLKSAKQIPAKVQACAQANQLGSPRIVYEPRSVLLLPFIFGSFALLLGVLIVGAYIFLYKSTFTWWPNWQSWLVLGVGIAWLGVGAWITLILVIYPHLRVYLCPKGLIYVKRAYEVIRWDTIETVSKEIVVQNKTDIYCSYTLRRGDGATFELKQDLPYVERLGGFIEREVARHLLPKVISLFKAGKIQEFGDVFVSDKGIGLKSTRRLLHWNELEKLVIDDTSVSIYRKGDSWAWTTVSISAMPNTGVLKGIVRHVKNEIRERILKEVIPIQSSQMQAYDAGFAISFGKLSLNKAGVSIHNSINEDILPWDEIASFGVGEDEVIIKRSGLLEEWYTLPSWTISDVAGLRQLVDYALWRQEQ
jgi:hypothetical protein